MQATARLSYGQYCGSEGHIKDGHRILHRDYVVSPGKVFTDP